MVDEFDVNSIHKMAISSFFRIFEKIAEGGLATDERGRIVWINEKYLDFLGLDATRAVIGRDVREVIPNSLIPTVLETGKPILFDVMEYPKGWCVVSRFPLKDQAGELVGAFGFVIYDNLDEMGPLIAKVQSLRNELRIAHSELRKSRRSKYSFQQFGGISPHAIRVKREGRLAAGKSATVLLTGETGTGKELIAQSIHAASARAPRNFVAVNMASIPEALMEAELFGAAPGAYTGADRKGRTGKIELANHGTLFLDEIGDMPLAMQAKLLRVLQEKELEPLGSNKIVPLDIRVIAATGRDLSAMVEAGEFRADLYYRLNVIPIDIPPLRQRLEDIPILCRLLLDEVASRNDLEMSEIDGSAVTCLGQYDWPGNVRELQNVLERASMRSTGGTITLTDIERCLPKGRRDPDQSPGKEAGKLKDQTLAVAVADLERTLMAKALKEASGNKKEAAGRLGVPLSTFYLKLKQYSL